MVAFRRRYHENKQLLFVCKYIVDIIMVIVAAYVLVSFIAYRDTNVGNSMNSILKDGDTVLVNRYAYSLASPKRYDVIAFSVDGVNSSKIYIKRVIGLPGETVLIKDGKVFINGEELEDDVVDTEILTAGLASTSITLDKDEYFVLGDNRNNSEDSRFSSIGTVKEDNIVGKVWFILSPVKRIKFVS
ncbi:MULTISPECIES: signal peptidase I [Lachnospira]|uniref:Signal peptidase I n=1 Tax=Lachnospira multipara TaxID=28051 RepID=A0A1H5RP87_9FIRM|nr:MULTISPECIES: signal peptidase I [Lachnospira]SEF39347.1 signal peptidase I [Lachnospira multipara]